MNKLAIEYCACRNWRSAPISAALVLPGELRGGWLANRGKAGRMAGGNRTRRFNLGRREIDAEKGIERKDMISIVFSSLALTLTLISTWYTFLLE